MNVEHSARRASESGAVTRRALIAGAAGAGIMLVGGALTLEAASMFRSADESVSWRRAAPRSSPPTPARRLHLKGLTPGSVVLGWDSAFDDELVTTQYVERDGKVHDELSGDAVQYADTSPTPGGSHLYRLVSVDADGNETPSDATVRVQIPPALLVEDFDKPLEGWQLNGLVVREGLARTGSHALFGRTSDGRTWADWTPEEPLGALSCQVSFRYEDKEPDRSMSVLRLRGPQNEPLCGLFVSPAGRLGVRNDRARVNVLGSGELLPGRWHGLWLHLEGSGASSRITAGVDGVTDAALADRALDLGDWRVGAVQLGEVGREKAYTLWLDHLVVWL